MPSQGLLLCSVGKSPGVEAEPGLVQNTMQTGLGREAV